MLLLAPFLTLLAIVGGGIASLVATVLNGPRRLRGAGSRPLRTVPPILTPEMRKAARAEQERDAVAVSR
jgi:hypothetical protein